MTKLGAAFWVGLVLTSGFTTYKVKYAVQDIEDQLLKARQETVADQQEIRVLTADWAYLNQPERLAALNNRFLHLVPISAKQLQQKITDIPLRAPAAAPEMLVAANSAAPTPAPEAAPPTPAAALPITPVAYRLPPAVPAAPIQLAKAEPTGRPNSLDALIAQIAEAP